MDDIFARIDAIIGDAAAADFATGLAVYFKYLCARLTLPCEVTGIEDFRWEEFYVFGPGDPDEYQYLRKTRPSYRDKYDLLEIEFGRISEWMLFHGDDLAAHVRRKSDKKKFIVGLAELEVIDKASSNHQLLDDFSKFVGNYR